MPDKSTVTFTDMNGMRFTYQVVSAETLHGDDAGKLLEHDGSWQLTLFTDSYSGLDRNVVRCTTKN